MEMLTIGKAQASSPHLPIIVDLDGTLTPSDTLIEGCLALFVRDPGSGAAALATLVAGRQRFKAEIARLAPTNADCLPVRAEFLEWLHRKRAEGHDIHLITAADQNIADVVAKRFDLFASAVGSGAGVNLKGKAKAAYLRTRFPEGFIYAGDSAADVHVWTESAGAVLVGRGLRHRDELDEAGVAILAEFPSPSAGWRHWTSLIRVHQWPKNVMIFVPLVLSHSWADVDIVVRAVLAFLIFNLIASSTYVLNDLTDLDADRAHETKRRRAMAAGVIAAHRGAGVAAAMLTLGLVLAALLSIPFFVTALAYLAITLAYSFRLKSVPLLDLAIIGGLFTLRVVMGIAACELPSSVWLLSFAMLFFFSLAAAKRHSELMRARRAGSTMPARRGYQPGDEALTLACGVSASFGAILIMLLYLRFEANQGGLYAHGDYLIAVPVTVLLWQLRIWLISQRGELHDDPVVFALRDRISWLAFTVIALAFALAI
jgi:4-hydroxybenzoate polyprenyltransferase